MQTDPIGYEDQMNLYAYVGNDPLNGTDPSGKTTMSLPMIWGTRVAGAGVALVPIPGARVLAVAIIAATIPGDSANNESSGSGDTPDVPEGIVGEQGHPNAGPTRGKTWNSGPLKPDEGGTGDPEADFDGPISDGEGGEYNPNRAPGNRTAPNGSTIRPSKDGPRIDIPASGDKPPETLHYPPKT